MATQRDQGENLFSLIVGPMVWAVHFLVVYVIIAIACAKGAFYAQVYGIGIVPLIVGVVTVIAVGLIVHGIVVAMRRWRGSLGERRVMPPHDQSDKGSRRRFMAYAGLLLCGLSLIATLWVALPVLSRRGLILEKFLRTEKFELNLLSLTQESSGGKPYG